MRLPGKWTPGVPEELVPFLRTPEEGPETGLYWGTYQQLKDICLPGRKLPQLGYGYRKIETEEAARKEWHDQGHRRPIPRFSL